MRSADESASLVLRWMRRFYLLSSAVAFVLVASVFVGITVVPVNLAGAALVCWIAASLFALGYVGIRNTTHGV